MKQLLFTNWDFTRWLRLVLGVFIAMQAIETKDTLSGVISAFLLFQAATNTGCCGVNNCAVPTSKGNQSKIEEVDYEEIKTK